MGKGRSSSAGGTTPRIERKIIEKNRRNRMKKLYSDLTSLLPNNDSKQLEGLPLPDQIDEAVRYIKSLNTKLDKTRWRKDFLLRRKTSDSCITTEQSTSKRTPLVEVHNMGPNLEVVLANKLEDYSKFHDIIRLVNQNGDEIASANFNKNGNSTVQVLQDKVAKAKLGFEGAMMSTQLNELFCGGSSSEQYAESRLDVRDYEIESNWEFGFIDASFP